MFSCMTLYMGTSLESLVGSMDFYSTCPVSIKALSIGALCLCYCILILFLFGGPRGRVVKSTDS